MTSVVAAFAHPDDETFAVGGTLAAAVEAGARVVAVCATRGEVGEIADPSLATREALGAVREDELRAACRELGIEDVRFLGYRDSGMAGSGDNEHPRAFANADGEEVIAALVRILREVRADFVLTFDPTGGYGHPDHVAMSRHVTAAFDAARRPRALLYSVFPRSELREWGERLRAAGVESDILREIEERGLGLPDDEIDLVVDVAPWMARKRRAIAAHRTQLNPQFTSLSQDARDRLMGREHFVVARGEPSGTRALLGLAAAPTI